MISFILAFALMGNSLTVSPVSFTYHNFKDPAIEKFYSRTIGKRTTVHPGLHLKYEVAYFQAMGWYFLDSFGDHAGGLMLGPKVDLWVFSLGAAAGPYVRPWKKATPLKFPLHKKVGPVAIAAVGGLTGSIKIPVDKQTSIETSCMSAIKIVNCSFGLNWEF